MKPGKKDFWTRAYLGIVTLGFGGFLVWAAFIPLSEGVTAAGQIIVEDNKKTVQHLEGGIVSKIFVHDGDMVAIGDPLFQIDPLQVQANRDLTAKQRAFYAASVDRIEAQLANASAISFPSKPNWEIGDDAADSLVTEQTSLFAEQKESLQAQERNLEARINRLKSSAEQRDAEINAFTSSLTTLAEELALSRRMLLNQLVPKTDVMRLEREQSRLDGEIAARRAQVADVASQITETETEITKLKALYRERLSEQLVEYRSELVSSEERLKATDDAVRRLTVFAPYAGKVMNLRFVTEGGVVGPGEAMMEIVPETNGLWAKIRVSPVDRDSVQIGMKVNARLSGLKSWTVPALTGEITGISADLIEIPETGQAFYEAKVLLDEETIRNANLPPLLPGMPVEAFVDSGEQRTLAEYLFEPIWANFSKGLSGG